MVNLASNSNLLNLNPNLRMPEENQEQAVAKVTPLEPKKPIGKPKVAPREARPKIGAQEKVGAPTFGKVRAVYH